MCFGRGDDPAGGVAGADTFYQQSVQCKGAFASPTDDWLSGWSWLACAGKLERCNAQGCFDRACSSLPPYLPTPTSALVQRAPRHTSIKALQNAVTADVGGSECYPSAAPLAQTYTVVATVSAVTPPNGFYVQDMAEPWGGIFVYAMPPQSFPPTPPSPPPQPSPPPPTFPPPDRPRTAPRTASP